MVLWLCLVLEWMWCWGCLVVEVLCVFVWVDEFVMYSFCFDGIECVYFSFEYCVVNDFVVGWMCDVGFIIW